jgi:hypothetical protein
MEILILIDGPWLAAKLIIAIRSNCSIITQVIEIIRAIIICSFERYIVLIPINIKVKMNTDSIRIYNSVKIMRTILGKLSTSSLG